jgi:hypothetical protein
MQIGLMNWLSVWPKIEIQKIFFNPFGNIESEQMAALMLELNSLP